jgi:hypothetical protein
MFQEFGKYPLDIRPVSFDVLIFRFLGVTLGVNGHVVCHRRDDEPLDLKRLNLLSRLP